jgi:hypothetical protein
MFVAYIKQQNDKTNAQRKNEPCAMSEMPNISSSPTGVPDGHQYHKSEGPSKKNSGAPEEKQVREEKEHPFRDMADYNLRIAFQNRTAARSTYGLEESPDIRSEISESDIRTAAHLFNSVQYAFEPVLNILA